MSILTAIHICESCGQVMNKLDSQSHKDNTGHDIRVKRIEVPNQNEVKPQNMLKPKRMLPIILQLLIKEETDWQNNFLFWIKQQQRRFQ